MILFCSSCGEEQQYTYAIKDFRKSLQPHLAKIVSAGIVIPGDTALRNMATDKELLQLSMSEHPVLRASAFREMLRRESFDDFKILMDHLDDTAMILTHAGEFGTSYRTVSDDLLMEAEWKTGEDRNKTIDEVLTRHNYLRSAYTILKQIPAQEKYYPFIKDMATRARNYDEDTGEEGFGDIEYALYGLAKFKKKEDIKIIKERLLEHDWGISELSFQLMREFPDTAYLEVFEEYYRYRFYRSFWRDQQTSKAVAFINSIASYKNQRSANILDSILNKKPTPKIRFDISYIKEDLVMAIWNNECIAYSKLRKQVEKEVREIEKHTAVVPPPESIDFSSGSPGARIRWW